MTERLEEIMEEVEIVVDGITDEVRGYELTKEQYEWFLLQASKVRELEEQSHGVELNLLNDEVVRLEQQNKRYKQALEDIRNKAKEDYFKTDIYIMATEALEREG